MKAEFPNEDNRFVSKPVCQHQDVDRNTFECVTIPAAALQHGPNFDFTYVVTSDNKAELRKVTPGAMDRDVLLIEKGFGRRRRRCDSGFDKLQPA